MMRAHGEAGARRAARLLRVLLVPAVSAALPAVAPARPPPCEMTVVYPRDGAGEVTTDTAIFLYESCGTSAGGRADAVSVLDAGGAEVACQITTISGNGDGGIEIRKPLAPLASDACYRVLDWFGRSVDFCTGSSSGEQPAPEVPLLGDLTPWRYTEDFYSDACTASVRVRFSRGGVVTLLSRTKAPRFDDQGHLEIEDVAYRNLSLRLAMPIDRSPLPLLPGSTLTIPVRAAAVNGAGELSGWSEPREIVVDLNQAQDECYGADLEETMSRVGCGWPGGGFPPSVHGALLVFLATRRRFG